MSMAWNTFNYGERDSMASDASEADFQAEEDTEMKKNKSKIIPIR